MFDYTGRKALAWLYVNKNIYDDGRLSTHCFVFPRYLIENSGYTQIESSDFPNRGAVLVDVKGGKSALDIENQFGNIIIIQFNSELQQNNNLEAENKFYARYNPNIPSTDVKINSVGSVPSHGLRQIIDFHSSYEILEQYKIIDLEINVVTTEVLVKIGDQLYGPFKTDKKGDNLTLSAINQYNFNIGQFHISQFNGSILTIEDERNFSVASFLLGFQKDDIFKITEKSHDWIPEDNFIKEMVKVLRLNGENKITREQKRGITAIIEETIKNSQGGFWKNKERYNKALKILAEIDIYDELKEQLVYEVLNNDEYLTPVVNYIEEERFDLIKDKLENISKAKKEYNHILENKKKVILEITQLNTQKSEIEKDITTVKKQIEKQESEALELLRSEIESLKKEKNELLAFNELAETNIELLKQKKKFEEDRDKAHTDYNRWVVDKVNIAKELDERITKITSVAALEMIDKEFLANIQNIVEGRLSDPTKEPLVFDNNLLLTNFDAEMIINHLLIYINEKAGRDYSKNDVINILTCLSQGFITTFAGEPGTGKTSLCNIVAKALGLVREDTNNRFIEVSVERGWSSYKDYIGYYNPLTKNFEKSNEKIFNAFEILNQEGDTSKSPYIILLDEANLSPIEHYWANFIRICDIDNNRSRDLNMGGGIEWKIPETLRFLATVNFDHTTEELSPRFLDRTWVIILEQSNINEDLQMDEIIENFNTIFDFRTILNYFAPKKINGEDFNQLDEAIKTKWSNIQEIFRQRNLPVSFRSKKMVDDYCLIASKYMDTDSAETRFAPLDYAIAQKILPSINGTGKKYKILIEQLLEEFSSMPLCKKHIERMKDTEEENMGYYHFFNR